MNREQCLDYLYADLVGKMAIFRSDFDRMMDQWSIRPINIDGVVVGTCMTHGNEIHVCLQDNSKLYARRVIKNCLIDEIKRHGFLTTRSMKNDASIVKWLGRFGFEITHEDAECFYYRIDNLKIK